MILGQDHLQSIGQLVALKLQFRNLQRLRLAGWRLSSEGSKRNEDRQTNAGKQTDSCFHAQNYLKNCPGRVISKVAWNGITTVFRLSFSSLPRRLSWRSWPQDFRA